MVQSNSIAVPANWLFGSFCLFQNSIRVLIATNGTYLDELYAPQPEAIASYDPVHFASNAPYIYLYPTNQAGQSISNVLIGFCFAPDGSIWTEYQCQWDSQAQAGYTVQPTAGRLYPTNCLIHYSAAGKQLGLFGHNMPLENCQGLAYCGANNTLYAVGNDASASANWFQGGPLAIFQVTLAGRVTEVQRFAPSPGSTWNAPVPASLCFPYTNQPYVAAYNLWYQTNVGSATNNRIVYLDVSGTNLALGVDAEGFVDVGPNGFLFPEHFTIERSFRG